MKSLILIAALLLTAGTSVHASEVADDSQLEAIENQMDLLPSSSTGYVCRAVIGRFQFDAFGYLPRRVQLRALTKCEVNTGYRCRAVGCTRIQTAQ